LKYFQAPAQYKGKKSFRHYGMKNAFKVSLDSNWQETDRPVFISIIPFGLDMEKMDIDILERLVSLDNGGRRSGGDRRNYSYTLHIPERRNGNNRRSGEDRRKIPRTMANPSN
jgi:hypothetical protein